MDDDKAVSVDDAYAGLSPRSRRKRKNRDQMRAARQREKETMDRLHVMVERLEGQFQKLQEEKNRVQTTNAPAAAASTALTDTSITSATYAEALALKARFQEENFHLKQTLYEKNKLKETLERHVGDFIEPTSDERQMLIEEFPDASGEAPQEAPSAANEPHTTAGESSYTPLSEGAVWAIIADVHRRMSVIKHALLATNASNAVASPSRSTVTVLSGDATSSAASDDGSVPSSPSSPLPPASSHALPHFLGWDIRHDCVHSILRFSFVKSFAHIAAFDAMVRMWDNEKSMYSYRDAPQTVHQTMGIVQQLNDDTYIFQRRLADASTDHRELVSTYMRYRLRTHDGGYLIGSVSIDDDILQLKAETHNDQDVRQQVWAAKLALWTEFIPTGEITGCCVRIVGTINLDSPAGTQRNLANLVIGLLRWENMHIGPMFALEI